MTIGVGSPDDGISEIVEESVSALCEGGRFKCRVNNLTVFAKMFLKDPLPYKKETIVKNAQEKKGDKIVYNLLNDNCEVFATECRYGVGFTAQGMGKQEMVLHGGVPDMLRVPGLVVVPLRWVKNVVVNVAALPIAKVLMYMEK